MYITDNGANAAAVECDEPEIKFESVCVCKICFLDSVLCFVSYIGVVVSLFCRVVMEYTYDVVYVA